MKMNFLKIAYLKWVRLYTVVRHLLYKILFGGGEDMMAMLWAQEIMCGNKTFSQVPKLLKEPVKTVLINSGCEELIVE